MDFPTPLEESLRKGSEKMPRLAFRCIRSAKQVKFESRFEHKRAGQKSEPFPFQGAFCNTSPEIAVTGDSAQQGPAKGSDFWRSGLNFEYRVQTLGVPT